MYARYARRLGWWLTKLTEGIGAVVMLGLVVMNFLQVFFRYAISDPLGWTEEAMRYALVWMVFLVACAALWRGEHMTIDILSEILPPRFRRIQRIVVLLCIALFSFILAWWGGPLALRGAAEVSPSAGIPMIVPMSAVAVGGLLMLVKAVILMTTDPGEPAEVPGGKGESR